MGIGLKGMGSALPRHRRENDFWDGRLAPRSEAQRQGDVLAVERSAAGATSALAPEIAAAMQALGNDDVFRGARVRHALEDDEEVAELEAAAVAAALQDARVAPEDVDLLLVHSMLPDMLIPNNGPALQDKCGLANAAAWSLDVGCGSLQAQVVTAAALLETGAFRCPVLVQSSCWSRFLDTSQPSSAGFGDAASALVLGRVPEGRGLLGHYARTDGRLREGIVFAPVRDGMPQRRWWDGTCAGAVRMTSFDVQTGKQAGQRATEFCREACLGALQRAGLAVDDVDLFLCNQSTGWFVDACRRSLGLPRERALENFAAVANINESSIVMNLERARQMGRLRDGSVVLAYSPSAGFTRSAIVLRWGDDRA
jgi:3-oxoacyl-[acyl-carrier-protein] synthase-3